MAEAQMSQCLAPIADRQGRPDPPIGKPRNPDGSINYGYLDLGDWMGKIGAGHCGQLGRGFVGNSRFASTATEQVIPRTNRAAQRKARK
jgi:hypothetical protein